MNAARFAQSLGIWGWMAIATLVAGRARGAVPARRSVRRAVLSARATSIGQGGGSGRRDSSAAVLLGGIGTFTIRLLGRVGPTWLRRRLDTSSPSRVGSAVVGCVALIVIAPAIAPLAAFTAWAFMGFRARRRRSRQTERTMRAIPDLIDLVRLALEGGCTTSTAFVALASSYDGALAHEVRLVGRDLAEGRGAAVALDGLLARVGEPIRPLCSALLAGERYGLATSTLLDALGAEARSTRRRREEQRARKLPITMLFPLITCTLPAFALLTVVPLLASGLQAVRW